MMMIGDMRACGPGTGNCIHSICVQVCDAVLRQCNIVCATVAADEWASTIRAELNVTVAACSERHLGVIRERWTQI